MIKLVIALLIYLFFRYYVFPRIQSRGEVPQRSTLYDLEGFALKWWQKLAIRFDKIKNSSAFRLVAWISILFLVFNMVSGAKEYAIFPFYTSSILFSIITVPVLFVDWKRPTIFEVLVLMFTIFTVGSALIMYIFVNIPWLKNF